jgi:cell division control protein 24
MFTGLSLSDISAISVIALPIYPDDLINAHHYDFGETAHIATNTLESIPLDEAPESENAPKYTTLQPLLLECQDIIHNMLQVPGMAECFDEIASPIDPLHHLWDVLSQTASLLVLVQALDPQVDSPFDGSWHIDSTHKRKRLIMGFLVYCRNDLGIPIDSLFTISDLTLQDCYGFSKVGCCKPTCTEMPFTK